ncbi:MAG: RNA chaperone Hfq [Alphaproteobacteria bacterium]|nr:RNA chaperone Hfq [Alphaproteobacteria bacterium]MDA8003488.1 RNA chaperone Hfq [Alphaproteobacteria bacterium]MDA8012537.1 RNA chaperone Hfq [Alphaproteobacteria bacterium]
MESAPKTTPPDTQANSPENSTAKAADAQTARTNRQRGSRRGGRGGGGGAGAGLQDAFLARARGSQAAVILTNGTRLQGAIRGFDSFSLVLAARGGESLVYKHAIASISPAAGEHTHAEPRKDSRDTRDDRQHKNRGGKNHRRNTTPTPARATLGEMLKHPVTDATRAHDTPTSTAADKTTDKKTEPPKSAESPETTTAPSKSPETTTAAEQTTQTASAENNTPTVAADTPEVTTSTATETATTAATTDATAETANDPDNTAKNPTAA